MEKIETQNIRTIHLVIIVVSLLVLVISIRFNWLLPVFFGLFFVLTLIRGEPESDRNKSWLSYIGNYLSGIATFCMVAFGIFTILWIWTHFSPYLTLLVIAMIVISVRFYRKYTTKGQLSELKKFRQLRHYEQLTVED
ncbi:MAG: hypothetical protein ACTSYI_14260 [Promethearchaeota archaeon]